MVERENKMALSIRTSLLSTLFIKNALKSQVISVVSRRGRNNESTCACSPVARCLSTTSFRRDSLTPNFYPQNAKVDEGVPRTGFVESKEDFRFVERLIPSLEPPTPPVHDQYPTPSGWSPPKGVSADTPYMVRRTRYHSIPVYLELKFGNSQQLTVIKNIEGDIWALGEELKAHLEGWAGYVLPMSVNEVTKQVRYKGMFRQEAKEWLAEKGF